METVHFIIFDHAHNEIKKVAMSENAYRALRWFIEEHDLEEDFELLDVEEEELAF